MASGIFPPSRPPYPLPPANQINRQTNRTERNREWFGPTSYFEHPSPSPPSELHTHFPTLLHEHHEHLYKPHIVPSTRGETISQLHDRLATALAGIIADVDREVAELESSLRPEDRTSKSVLIVSHAAPLIAIGRALTGRMPEDANEEDFNVFTAGLSRFVRRGVTPAPVHPAEGGEEEEGKRALAPGTKIVRSGTRVPDWIGNGVGGGWDCIENGDCSFLSGGAERGWLVVPFLSKWP